MNPVGTIPPRFGGVAGGGGGTCLLPACLPGGPFTMTTDHVLGAVLFAGIVVGNLVTLLATGIFLRRTAAGRRFLRDRLGPPPG
ncbi:hypothetical protein [Komagataeibacter rhaeticus]|uniref:hypothetical protein n=1 Tax=Komagataeibacter rhaeticus TaxID=215221 RepID=UPI0039EC2778